MGESTTATGRAILRHQVRKVAEILDGEYNINPPLDHESLEKAGGVFPSESTIYGDSVSGDTLIDLLDGKRVPISHLFTNITFSQNGKEYCDLKGLVQALTYDKNTNKTTYRPIKYVMRHKTVKQMYRVWITNSQYVDVTEDHSLIGYANLKGRTNTDSSFLCEIKPTNIAKQPLLYVKQKPHTGNIQFDSSILPEVYTLMGYVVAGNSYVDATPTGGVFLSVNPKHVQDIENSILIPLKCQEWISSWTFDPKNHIIQISSIRLWGFLRRVLYETGIKKIPSSLLFETTKNIQHFLRGMFSASGFITVNKIVCFCSVEQYDIETIQELLFKCGISSVWFTENNKNFYVKKHSSESTKRLIIKSTEAFKEKIGFIISEKNKRLQLYVPNNTKKFFSHYDFELVRTYKVEKLPIVEQYVYDIEVDDTHVFFANNILVHNTDSVYFKTHGRDQKEATLIADAIAKQVNKSFQPFMQQAFLCNPGFDDIIKSGREVVSDRGIFVDKKRYVLHLVDLDGHIVDKMKVMGLELKKTTLPKPIATRLSSYIERLLKGEQWNNIQNDIVNFKEELLKTNDIMLLGLPKGIKGIEEYTKNFRLDPNTRLPGHVAASLFYNNMLQMKSDKESVMITSNMKIKVFYLTKSFDRFKSIALPTDTEHIPSWFLTDIVPFIDREAQIQRLVDDPLQHIFKAIGKEVPSKQSMLVDDLLEF